jgi:hypothetical protein
MRPRAKNGSVSGSLRPPAEILWHADQPFAYDQRVVKFGRAAFATLNDNENDEENK